MSKKSIISVILLAVLVFGLVGCTGTRTTSQPVVYQQPFPKKGIIGGIEYSITPDAGYYRKSKTAGYFIDTLDEPNAPYMFFITSGEKPTTGYGVNIVNIEMDDQNNMVVTVEFTEPTDKNVTKEKTNPTTCLSVMPPYPADVVIQLTNGDMLKYLED